MSDIFKNIIKTFIFLFEIYVITSCNLEKSTSVKLKECINIDKPNYNAQFLNFTIPTSSFSTISNQLYQTQISLLRDYDYYNKSMRQIEQSLTKYNFPIDLISLIKDCTYSNDEVVFCLNDDIYNILYEQCSPASMSLENNISKTDNFLNFYLEVFTTYDPVYLKDRGIWIKKLSRHNSNYYKKIPKFDNLLCTTNHNPSDKELKQNGLNINYFKNFSLQMNRDNVKLKNKSIIEKTTFLARKNKILNHYNTIVAIKPNIIQEHNINNQKKIIFTIGEKYSKKCISKTINLKSINSEKSVVIIPLYKTIQKTLWILHDNLFQYGKPYINKGIDIGILYCNYRNDKLVTTPFSENEN